MTDPRSLDRYCTFRLGDLRLGIGVEWVQEVLRPQPSTPVPRTTSIVGGLLNLRGEIVTTIDLGERLGVPVGERADGPMNVVVRTPDGVVALLVDAIEDVIDVDDDAFEPAPSTLPESLRALLIGVYKLEGALLLVLDADRVTSLSVDEIMR